MGELFPVLGQNMMEATDSSEILVISASPYDAITRNSTTKSLSSCSFAEATLYIIIGLLCTA
jgi:hypothetical protein